MTKQKTQKTRQIGTQDEPGEPKQVVYDSIAAAVTGMPPYTKRQLQAAKELNCPGFRGSRVYPAEALPWLAEHDAEIRGAGTMDEADLEKRLEEIRKLRLANDAREERLVEKAWVRTQFARTAGEINAFRSKSEAEHPMRFAAAMGDVALCRTVVRGIWDDVMKSLQSGIANHLE